MKLNAFLARAGVASRRSAGELIKASRVQVNDQIGQLNSEVSDQDKVKVDGKPISAQPLRYILLNKPRHTVTTLNDPEGRPTVADVIDIKERVVPVGRLDTNTTGALLLTNDGELAHKLMHPSFEVDKVYEVIVDGEITAEKLQVIEEGVELEDLPAGRQVAKTAPAKARKLADDKLELTIHEGRKHQVKRMLSAVGLTVIRLHRSQYGPLNLKGLKPGQWRELSTDEVKSLRSAFISQQRRV